MTNPTYKATRDGFIIGTHYAKDEPVPLSDLQAKYLTAPYGDAVYVPEDKPVSDKPAPTKSPAKD